MKKIFWWKIGISGLSLFLLGYGYLVIEMENLNLYNKNIDALLFLSLSLFLVSPFLFFIKDKTFFLWLKLALIWSLLAFFLVALAPEYQGGWLGMGPTKESVSLYMGGIFFLGSLLLFVWHWFRKS